MVHWGKLKLIWLIAVLGALDPAVGSTSFDSRCAIEILKDFPYVGRATFGAWTETIPYGDLIVEGVQKADTPVHVFSDDNLLVLTGPQGAVVHKVGLKGKVSRKGTLFSYQGTALGLEGIPFVRSLGYGLGIVTDRGFTVYRLERKDSPTFLPFEKPIVGYSAFSLNNGVLEDSSTVYVMATSHELAMYELISGFGGPSRASAQPEVVFRKFGAGTENNKNKIETTGPVRAVTMNKGALGDRNYYVYTLEGGLLKVYSFLYGKSRQDGWRVENQAVNLGSDRARIISSTPGSWRQGGFGHFVAVATHSGVEVFSHRSNGLQSLGTVNLGAEVLALNPMHLGPEPEDARFMANTAQGNLVEIKVGRDWVALGKRRPLYVERIPEMLGLPAAEQVRSNPE